MYPGPLISERSRAARARNTSPCTQCQRVHRGCKGGPPICSYCEQFGKDCDLVARNPAQSIDQAGLHIILEQPNVIPRPSGKGVSRRSGRSQHSEEGTGSSLITTALVLRPPKACPLRKQRSDRAYTNKSKSTQNHPDMSHDEVPIQSQSQLGDTMVHINPVTQVNQSGLFSVFSLQQVDAPSTSLDGQTGGQNPYSGSQTVLRSTTPNVPFTQKDLDDLHHSFKVLQDVVLVDDVPSPVHDIVGLDVYHDAQWNIAALEGPSEYDEQIFLSGFDP